MTITHDKFVERISEINPNIEIIGKYTKSSERIKVRCRICGKEWSPLAYSLSSGKGCPHCSAVKGAKNNRGKTGVKGSEAFAKQLHSVNDSIEIVGKYENTHTDITCKCLRCGHIWKAKPYSLLQGHGCPQCSKSGTSFMEQFLFISFCRALGEDKVVSRDRSIIGMELDIYIPSLKLAVEPGNWNLHKTNLSRDRIKRDKCKNIGITLYTIYDAYPSNTLPPFSSNCIIYDFDLNKADHHYIQGLVYQLFRIAGIVKTFSDDEFKSIEKQAYRQSKSITHEEFVKRVRKIHPDIQILGHYYNSNRKLKVKCQKCGYEWDAVPANLLSGDGCRKCGTVEAHEKFIKGQDEFKREIQKVNPDVEIIGEYTGRHRPVLARCRICGYIWNPQASSLLRGSSHKGSKTMHMAYENDAKKGM